MNCLDRIPSRIKYYLLDWKDRNMDEYLKMYPDKRLIDLNFDEIHQLYSMVITRDSACILNSENKIG